jgi:hypothetical protein
MFISVFGSGTNVQRLAKCSKHIDGVIYSSYSQLEKTEPGIIKRKFYCLEVNKLRDEVIADIGEAVMPSWTKVWGRPYANQFFIEQLLQSLTGKHEFRSELNLSSMVGRPIDCFMLLVSANNKEMGDIAEIANRSIPEWHVKILNGDHTTNKKAEDETLKEINEARIAGKKGILIIANQMGSRSYGVSEIQATVIAYDRGSIDATQQKVSRCLDPGKLYDGSDKEFGAIVNLSFDPNRSENIERLILEEAIQVHRSGEVDDFTKAVKYVLSSINVFKINKYGYTQEVTEDEFFKIYSDNETMLKVADISVDIDGIVESGMFDILLNVNADGKGNKDKKPVVSPGVKNTVTVNGKNKTGKNTKNKDIKNKEQIINDAIKALNMSATSVYYLSNLTCSSYRDCLTEISIDPMLDKEFKELFGLPSKDVIILLTERILNEAILDVIVQNSKPNKIDFLF